MALAAAGVLSLSSCNGFLDTKPNDIMTQDQVYADPALVKSVLANFYGRITFGQRNEAVEDYFMLDEAIHYDNNSDENIDRNKWRPYDYTLIRNLNQFLQGIKGSTAVDEETKRLYEGEVRYIRAWTYFCIARGLGGIPIVGDDVFDYTGGMDITTIQVPRSTEAETYDYIIKECQEAAAMMSKQTNKNNSRANYWVAKMLEARAAITAASLATYNTVAEHPQLRTAGGEVGIPADKAEGYYRTALAAAKEVIEGSADGTASPYKLMLAADKTSEALADNFFKAVCEKSGNTEVIWTRDYATPGYGHEFTKNCLPKSIEQDTGSDRMSVLLNLVEAYESTDATEAERGKAAKFDIGTLDDPKFFDDPMDLFADRDPRLAATVLLPGSTFDGKLIELQAGQLNKVDGRWTERTGRRNETDAQGRLITANNGPFGGNEREINRTGFFVRKYLDKTPLAGTQGTKSAMWNVYFRISEAYLIAAEASWELSHNNSDVEALKYINAVRERAGIQPLTSIDHQKIMHEYQVEFAFEGHRWWDLKRWMEADNIWTGNENDRTAQRLGLWPYRVVAEGDVNNGKWVFVEKNMQTLDLWRKPLKCTDVQYYSEIDNGWINEYPDDSAPYTSTIVFLVRKGNPKNIHDWDDLTKDGVGVITPNPKTSGGARWNYMAAWAYAEQAYNGDEAQMTAFIKKLYNNVQVLDSGARGATTSFVENGQGDVLIAWENEAYLSMRDYPDEYEIVTPSISILAQPSVAVVDHVVDKRGTRDVAEEYLNYLYSDDAQRIAAKNYFRPVNPEILQEYADVFDLNVKLVSIEDFGGWDAVQTKHFADGGIFDQIYEK